MTDDTSLQSLSFLIGSLSGPERLHPTPWTQAGAGWGTVHGQWGSGGTVLVQHQTQERDGRTSFQAVNVFMRDPDQGDILLYSFDSVGYPPDPAARGTWSGGELVLERSTVRGSGRTTYSPQPGGGYRWSKHYRAPGDGTWIPLVEGHLVAEPAGPGA